VPTTFQQLLADLPVERFDDYLTTERRLGVRHLGGTGRVQWLAAFAPVGPAEPRALGPGVSSPAELDEELVTELGWGVATASADSQAPSPAGRLDSRRSPRRPRA
jgi:hypothetical protein